MSDPTEPVATNNGPPDEDLTVSVEDIINSFLELNSEPTEEQVHSLAVMLGMTPEDFEAILYEMFGDLVNENVDPEELTGEEDGDDDEDDDEGDYDPTEVFLILYFMRNPKPSDEQIHALAELINMSTEEIEETIFRLLSEFEADDDNKPAEGEDGPVVEPQVADNTAVDDNGLPEVAPQDPGTLKISDETPTLAGTQAASDNDLPDESPGGDRILASVPAGNPAPSSVSSDQPAPTSATQ